MTCSCSRLFPLILTVLCTATLSQEDYSSWLYYKKGYINTKASGAAVTNPVGHIPVLIRLTNSNFNFAKALPGGTDVRFSDSTGGHLPYEIEYWNETAESAAVWIWVDTIAGNDSLSAFRIYYGSTGAADSSNSRAVFDTADGFMGVWHLGEDASGQGTAGLYHDATIRGNNGADSVGSTGKDGCIGNGQQFNGSTDRISSIQTPGAGSSDWTVSAWVKTSATSAGMVITNRRVASEVSLSLHVGWWAGAATSNGNACFSNDGPGCEFGAQGTTNLTTTADWHYLVGKRTSANTYNIYVDGSLEATNNASVGSGCQEISASSTSQWEIGKGDAWTVGWNGYIDEVRLSKVSRSADWIKLSWALEKPASQVVTLSSEYANPVVNRTWDGGGSDGKWSTAANWLGDQVPDSTDRVLFNFTSTKSCTLDVNGKASSITFTSGYTGNFSFSADTLRVWGSADFSTGGTISAGTGVLDFYGSQNFTPVTGVTFPKIVRTGAGVTTLLSKGLITGGLIISGGTVRLGSGLIHSIGLVTGSGSIDFGSSTLRTGATPFDLSTLSSITPGSGTLEFNGSASQVFTPKSAATHPALSHTGSNTLQLSTNNLAAASFSQSGGTLDLSSINITTTGNFDVTTGSSSFANLNGRKITVGGNATFTGTSGSKVNLNPASVCTLAVTGSLVATYANIANNRASVSTGYAYSSDSTGPDFNWVFDAEDYATEWTYHRNVFVNTTVSGSPIAAAITNFPVLVRLTSANFPFSECLTDSGKDLRFSLASGVHLSYEIEWWDSAGGNAVVWVLLPQVLQGIKTQKFTMHWGKTGANTKSSPSSVFQTSNNFQGVWHLTEDLSGAAGSAIYRDATSNNITGNDYVAATNKTGVVGRGQEFSATPTDRIDFADFTSTNWSAITIEGWANPKTLQNTERSIVRKETQFQLGINNPSTGNIRNLVTTSGTTGWTANNDQVVSLSAGTWYSFAFTYDDAIDALKHFVNGTQQGSDKLVSGTVTDNANRFCIGSNTDGTTLNFDAYIDEVRISNVARSADWLKLCYDNQKSGSSVVHCWSPVVSGRNDTVLIGASQRDADSGVLWYELEDPNTSPVSISAEFKTASGGSWAAITTATGNTGNVDTSATTDREIRWRVKTEPGTGIETSYLVRVIASDGSNKDTTQSAGFSIDTKVPAGLAAFRPTDSTVSSIRLGWTAATETNFDHYEIRYGTNRTNVQNRTASIWTTSNDTALATVSTSTTLITGLSTSMRYYFKIWAIDRMGNEATVTDTTASTFSQVSPVWSMTSYGTIYGGAIRDSVIYIAGGNGKLSCVNLSDGGMKWNASPSGGGNPNRPSYAFYGSTYKIVYSAGNWVYGVRDNGASKTDLFSQNLGATAGIPYISPNDSTFVVAYSNTLTQRKVTDGSVVSGWPQTVTGISTTADPVVYGDVMYVAGSDGSVYQYDVDGTLLATCNVGAAVNQPLLEDNGRLYITPSSARLFCFSTSPFDTIWELNVTTANTGPCFKLPGSDTLWLATGSAVRQVRDGGASGSVLWSYTVSNTVTSGPICMGDNVLYFGINGGSYFALDRATQTPITNWPYRSATGNANTGPWMCPLLNRVLFGTDAGNLDAFTLP